MQHLKDGLHIEYTCSESQNRGKGEAGHSGNHRTCRYLKNVAEQIVLRGECWSV